MGAFSGAEAEGEDIIGLVVGWMGRTAGDCIGIFIGAGAGPTGDIVDWSGVEVLACMGSDGGGIGAGAIAG